MIQFNGKTFCFTGSMANLKRADAEQAARARGAMTCDRVNGLLDYLVIGSVPNPQWKFGKYGSKIAAAHSLRAGGRGPQIVSEHDFLTALAAFAPTNSGDIDAKIVVVTFKFTGDPEKDDWTPMDNVLRHLRDDLGCHISLTSFPLVVAAELFEETLSLTEVGIRIHCRVVNVMALDDPSEAWAQSVNEAFLTVPWLRDTKLHWFERREGTAGFIRLMTTIPSSVDLPTY